MLCNYRIRVTYTPVIMERFACLREEQPVLVSMDAILTTSEHVVSWELSTVCTINLRSLVWQWYYVIDVWFLYLVDIDDLICEDLTEMDTEDMVVCGTNCKTYPSTCQLLQDTGGTGRVAYAGSCDNPECFGGHVSLTVGLFATVVSPNR